MKKMTIIVLLLLATLALVAHPAGKVNAAYDAKTQLLTVDFAHKVSNAADHFVFNIIVQINGKKAIEQNIGKQEAIEGGSFVYKLIDLKKGDKVTVTADCNKGGKKSASITIP